MTLGGGVGASLHPRGRAMPGFCSGSRLVWFSPRDEEERQLLPCALELMVLRHVEFEVPQDPGTETAQHQWMLAARTG